MSKNYALTAQKRDRAGKGVARALRRENRIPSVVYGDNKPPVMISFIEKDVTLQFQKGGMRTHVCDLTVDGEKMQVMARDVQFNPVSDRIEHIDFMRISAKTKVTVHVPIHFVNQEECPGIKLKGILNIVHHDLSLRCPATAVPEYLEVDLSKAELGTALHLSDIKLPKGAEVMGHTEPNFTLATIVAPTVKGGEEAAAPAAAAAASPAAAAAPAKAEAKPAAKK